MDFVSAPGQFAIRGSIIDIFSYSFNFPYRISFWGNEIEKIHSFDCNTQLSKEEFDKVSIISDIISKENNTGKSVLELLPQDAVVWLDSADLYSDKEFYPLTSRFRQVFFQPGIEDKDSDAVQFLISPQPAFNKNFELLTEDIRNHIERGYKVYIYGEKPSQLERLKAILNENGGLIPEFVPEKNIHNGFVDAENNAEK